MKANETRRARGGGAGEQRETDVSGDKGAGQHRSGPDDQASSYDPLAAPTVAQEAEQRRHQHVDKDKRRLQKARVRVIDLVVLLHLRQYR